MSPLLLVLSRPTARVLEDAAALGDWRLSAPEEERMSRLQRSADRDDFLAAHLLVRICAARVLDLRPEEVSIVQHCPTCGGPHGRPELDGHPEVGVSLAHSRGVVAAAAGTVPVGVDVEAFPAAGGLAAGDLSAALTAAEMAAIDSAPDPGRAVLLAWARKEACLKAGLVDLDGLDGFDLSALPLGPPPGGLVPRSVVHGSWAVHDWWDGRAGAIGVVVAPAGARLTLAGA
ncbi:MAG: 4'-phosphopantetheinyl transferase superfamily protein [Actinomycetota bacterium]|jgi:4'-phosphopantetheinyl transferase